MSAEEVIVKTKNLSCQSGFRFLLKEINWEVKRGEHWAVLGMNGSGKTTLLSIIAGYKQHTSGDWQVFGEHYSNENILEFRKRIGWVSASFYDRFYTKESALNIVLSGMCGTLGIDDRISRADVRRAKMLLRELGQADRLDTPFDMMSKGERQNVLIARALMVRPEILVLDEPATGLDIVARQRLNLMIKNLADRTDMTIIYVTHYLEEITPEFQHILLLKNGRAYAKGLTEELLTTEVMSKFLDRPIEIVRQMGVYQSVLEGGPELAQKLMR